MTDLQISKALALAIGWKRMLPNPEADGLQQCWVWTGHSWRVFDYRDWAVIGPIAERYFAFPSQFVDRRGKVVAWEACLYSEARGCRVPFSVMKADTPQKAIALAVIGSLA